MGYILSAVVLIIITLCIAIFFHISLFSPFVISALSWLLPFFSALFFYEDFYPLTGNVFSYG